MSPVDQSEPEPQLGPEVGVLADGLPQFLTDLDETLQDYSVGHGFLTNFDQTLHDRLVGHLKCQICFPGQRRDWVTS